MQMDAKDAAAALDAPEDGDEVVVAGDMQAQLVALYREQERLHEAVGTADSSELIAMIKSLEAQLRDLYAERERAFLRGERRD